MTHSVAREGMLLQKPFMGMEIIGLGEDGGKTFRLILLSIE
jgi:hypothetical protein